MRHCKPLAAFAPIIPEVPGWLLFMLAILERWILDPLGKEILAPNI